MPQRPETETVDDCVLPLLLAFFFFSVDDGEAWAEILVMAGKQNSLLPVVWKPVAEIACEEETENH